MLRKSMLSLLFASVTLTSTVTVYPIFWKKKTTAWQKTKQNVLKGLKSDSCKKVVGVVAVLTAYFTFIGILLALVIPNKNFTPRPPDTSFEDDFAPGTIGSGIKRLRDVIKYLGLENIPRTILLYGPTSTGKTHTAKALVQELGAEKYIELTGPELRQSLEGASTALLHKVFRQALQISKRTKKPCVIIINEIDGGTAGIHNIRTNGLSRTIAQTMQGILDRKEYKDIFVIATSNFVSKDDIPRALLERFEEQIEVDLPNKEQRESIIQFYCQKNNIELDGNTDYAELTKGFNVRRIKTWVKKIKNRKQIEAAKAIERQKKKKCSTSRKPTKRKKKREVSMDQKITVSEQTAQEELDKVIKNNVELSGKNKKYTHDMSMFFTDLFKNQNEKENLQERTI